ncbi:2-oxoadipate dioxygenase/decarboxylase family protein [Streptomyces sioyaensis]|uniref:2-oxoadipate dioxygenase/decarboxylase family protein n=1 Tax=Streptomyces sioyaensis TaxID=67364 RepID=UPI0037A4BBE4
MAYFRYHVVPDRPGDGSRPPAGHDELLSQGWVRAEPFVYEDFLPRSAAGSFQSNLSDEDSRNNDRTGIACDSAWLSGAIGCDILDPCDLYEQQQRSVAQVARELPLDGTLG